MFFPKSSHGSKLFAYLTGANSIGFCNLQLEVDAFVVLSAAQVAAKVSSLARLPDTVCLLRRLLAIWFLGYVFSAL